MISLKLLVIVLMVITLGVVAAGFIILATNKGLNQKYGNRLMSIRITLQVVVIILLGLMFALQS